jgi:hypothetical protein
MSETFERVEGNPFQDAALPQQPIVGVPPGIEPLPVPTEQTGELSQAGLSFANSLKAATAYLSTTDPQALQDIVVKNIPGTRPGVDEQGNPYVVLEGRPFYLNKPGMSGADAYGFVGDLIAFAPVGRIAGMFQSGLSRVLAAGGGSGLISAGKESVAQLMGSEQPFDTARVALDTVFGAAGQRVGDALQAFMQARRPVVNEAGEYTPEFIQATINANIDLSEFGEAGRNVIANAYRTLGRSFAGEAQNVVGQGRQTEAGMFGIPLTRGQATGDVRQMATEEAMRMGGRGGQAQKTMLGFEQQQQQSIQSAIGQNLFPQFAPRLGQFRPEPQVAGSRMLTSLQEAQNRARQAATQAYEQVSPESVRVVKEAFSGLEPRLRQAFDEADVIVAPDLTPKTVAIVNRIREALPQAGAAEITEVSLKQIEKVRRQIGKLAKDAARGSSDEFAARQALASYDSWLDDAIANNLAKGDPEQLNLLKQARSLYRNYAQAYKEPTGKFAKGTAGETQKLIAQVLNEGRTPTEAMNLLFGYSKLGEKQATARVARRLKEVLGESSLEFETFRSAAFTRLFEDAVGNVKPPQVIVREIDNLIMGNGAATARELFTPQQISALRNFRSAVSRTITPDIAKNPSRTGYEVARLAQDAIRALGLTQAATSAASGDIKGTIAGGLMLGARELRNALGARTATRPGTISPGGMPSVRLPFNLSTRLPGPAATGVASGGLLSPEQ